MRDARGSWYGDHLWAKVYGRVSAGSPVGRALWRVFTASSVDAVHARARAALAPLPPGARVLDVPCGSGLLLRDLPADLAVHYVAADISPAMLRRTRAEADRLGLTTVETREADVQQLTDADDAYDLVLTFTGLHCFPDPAGAVGELARVLRPGGRLVGSTFATDAGRRWVPVHAAGRAIGVLGPGGTRADAAQWLEAAGLVDVVVEQEGAFTFFAATAPGDPCCG